MSKRDKRRAPCIAVNEAERKAKIVQTKIKDTDAENERRALECRLSWQSPHYSGPLTGPPDRLNGPESFVYAREVFESMGGDLDEFFPWLETTYDEQLTTAIYRKGWQEIENQFHLYFSHPDREPDPYGRDADLPSGAGFDTDTLSWRPMGGLHELSQVVPS